MRALEAVLDFLRPDPEPLPVDRPAEAGPGNPSGLPENPNGSLAQTLEPENYDTITFHIGGGPPSSVPGWRPILGLFPSPSVSYPDLFGIFCLELDAVHRLLALSWTLIAR